MRGRILILALVTVAGCAEQDPTLDTDDQQIQWPDAAGFALVEADTDVVAANSFNSESGAISVARAGDLYVATFENMAGSGGIAQVVAVGTDEIRCKLRLLSVSSGDQLVYYHCHDSAGNEQDSAAVVQYYREPAGTSSPSAYVHADDPTLPFAYCPSSTTWNSEAGDNCITRTGTGTYEVVLEDLAALAGSVQITAFGDDSAYCNVTGWGPIMGTDDQEVLVECFDTGGSAADSEFMLNYFGDEDTSTFDYGAYAWANNSTSGSYTPTTGYSYNSPEADCLGEPAISAGKQSTGTYFLHFDDKEFDGSAVHVTAFGADNWCKINDWYDDSGDLEIITNCYAPNGNLVDMQYVGTMASDLVIGPCE